MVEPATDNKAAWLDARLSAALAVEPMSPTCPTSPAGHTNHIEADSETAGDGDDLLGDGDPDPDPDDSLLFQSGGASGSMSCGYNADRSDNIRVFVRARPPNTRESSATCREIVRVDVTAGAVHLFAEPPRSFAFDGVLGESASQEEVFALVGAGIGEACLSGYNGSIYVYGQTGSGKTHTMQGPVASVQAMHSDDRRGIMCRILALIFSEVGRRHQEVGSVQYTCKCSYLQIYKEQIADLLEASSTNLQVREDVNRGVYVERLSEHSVWNLSDALHAMWKGLHLRHVGATQMNELSSRSHAVFTLVMEATSTTAGGVTSTWVARLNLIDLAGSERQSFDPRGHTAPIHESLRVKEAGAINRSLSALTNVIMSLSHMGQRRPRTSTGSNVGTSGQQRRPFVRYRDSKLTFLLRDSLGGNSKTVIVACVSPSALCFGETLSTLKFAARAKHIRCVAVKNEEYSGTVESLMLEVKNLKQQLELLSSRGLIPESADPISREGTLVELGGGDSFAQHAVLTGNTTAQSEDMSDRDKGEEESLFAGRDSDELRRLYGPRRVRRLEILLAAALDRERRCELRRHKLDKFTQYLNGFLERKEHYFDAIRDYFAYLVDHAATEACYYPEVTARLIAFRHQLCNVSTDSQKIAANIFKDEGFHLLMADGSGVGTPMRPTSLASTGTLTGLSPAHAVGDDVFDTPTARSRSSGTLPPDEAVGRRGRRGISQSLQFKTSLGRLLRGSVCADSPASASASSATLSSPVGGAWFPDDSADFEDEELLVLRMENRLLRRQLESHPELYRLAAENRLLREHLAFLVQQHALAREEPTWPKGHKHRRRAHDGFSQVGQPKKDRTRISRDRSLTRTSRSSIFVSGDGDGSSNPGSPRSDKNTPKEKGLALRPFPGISDATQISPSSSSMESEATDSDRQSPPLGGGKIISSGGNFAKPSGSPDATSFLPTMSREVEELLRIKGSLEDGLQQLTRSRAAAAVANQSAGRPVGRQPPVSPRREQAANEAECRVANEILQGATEALRFTEAMLSKGKGDTLLLSADGAANPEGDVDMDEGGGPGMQTRSAEGLDERDVFLSLMRSLPSDGPPSLVRRGYASSAPHLLPSSRWSGAGLHAGVGPPLRASNSTGSAGARLLRNRSTIQLHCIAEQPVSPLGQFQDQAESGVGKPRHVHADSAGTTAIQQGLPRNADEPKHAGDMLQNAGQKVRQLCHQLELVGDKYRDMRAQFTPLQEEYNRRLEECRFLEAQCRRLDVHCRLLEERAIAMDATSSSMPLLLSRGPGLQAKKLGGMWQSYTDFSTGPTHAEACAGEPIIVTPPVVSGTKFCTTGAKMPSTLGPPAAGSVRSSGLPVAGAACTTTSSSKNLGKGPSAMRGPSPSSGAPLMTSGRPEVPPRGLLYAASVQEFVHAEQHVFPRGVGRALHLAGMPWRVAQDDLRRVYSAPQLPVTRVQERFGTAPSNEVGGHKAVFGSAVPLVSQQLRPNGSVGGLSRVGSEIMQDVEAASVLAASEPAFSSSKFLSLARQSGAKTAALQYLITSTSHSTKGSSSTGSIRLGEPPPVPLSANPSKTAVSSSARTSSSGGQATGTGPCTMAGVRVSAGASGGGGAGNVLGGTHVTAATQATAKAVTPGWRPCP